MRYRRFYRQRNPAVFGIICAVIIILISILLLDARLRPAVYDLAALEAYAISSKRVNSAVEKILSQNAPAYFELVSINYSDSNAITGITTDIVKMNLFKSQVTNAIDSEFNSMGETDVSVALGTASGIVLFSGMGPYVDVDIGFSSSTKTDFENVFESAGINQTQHSVMLNVETTVMLSLSGRRIPKTVETSFCVAQTVIVGSVPDVMVE
ncbi:MAG: sporulation protein YunB [Clostridia bacterium]|nr:sporulation protein YunB [Clostridia bacterium]